MAISWQLVRAVPGEPSDVAVALVAAGTDGFRDLPDRHPAAVSR